MLALRRVKKKTNKKTKILPAQSNIQFSPNLLGNLSTNLHITGRGGEGSVISSQNREQNFSLAPPGLSGPSKSSLLTEAISPFLSWALADTTNKSKPKQMRKPKLTWTFKDQCNYKHLCTFDYSIINVKLNPALSSHNLGSVL